MNKNEKRSEKRACFAPADMGHWVECRINGEIKSFKVLNMCENGIGMLVRQSDADILDVFRPDVLLTITHITPRGRMEVNALIRHVSPITKGEFKGGGCVGFSISI
ncbi:MAG: hypothetical protein U9P10_07075 [Thermodesulfobacteriota bacterium]|nr:hypothetical protein [Thermodesulfobacteriota bacterium]